MHDGFKAQGERVPHSLAASLCRARKRFSLGHDEACGTVKFLTQPSQSAERFRGTMPYQRRRLSWNSSLDNSVPIRHW